MLENPLIASNLMSDSHVMDTAAILKKQPARDTNLGFSSST